MITRRHHQQLLTVLAALFLVTLHLTLLLKAAEADAQTHDEPVHILVGYSVLTSGRYDIDRIHPPLARVLVGAPLLLLGVHPPDDPKYYDPAIATRYQWPMSIDFIYRTNATIANRIIFATRLPVIFVSCLGVLMVFIWLTKTTNLLLAFLVSNLYATDPNILAHGHLATTDSLLTVLVTTSIVLGSALLSSRKLRLLIPLSVVIGLAMATKVTGLLVVPALLISLVVYYLIYQHIELRYMLNSLSGRLFGRWSIFILVACLIIILTIWTLYGFQSYSVPLTQAQRIIPLKDTAIHNILVSITTSMPIPLRDYIRVIAIAFLDNDVGRVGFLLGTVYHKSTPMFFVATLLLKSTMALTGLVLLTLMAQLLILRHQSTLTRRQAATLSTCISAVCLFIIVASLSNFNIGLRHVLPIIPLIYMIIGITCYVLLCMLRLTLRRLGVAVVASVVFLGTFETLMVTPYYLTFFARPFGGPENGYHLLVDSNLDWGQGLKDLGAYVSQHDLTVTRLRMASPVPPEFYGIRIAEVDELASEAPPPGLYVFGATPFQMDSDPLVNYFRGRRPDALIANSILLFDTRSR